MEIKSSDVIKGPIVTPKSIVFNKNKQPKIVIEVHVKSNKFQIRDAVKLFFGHDPIKINVILLKGKNKFSKRHKYQEKNRKKAILTFKDNLIMKDLGYEDYAQTSVEENEVAGCQNE